MIKNYFYKNALKKFCASIVQPQIVTPWKVEGKIDYKKLVDQFGTELIDKKLIQRFELAINKKVHPWISRSSWTNVFMCFC